MLNKLLARDVKGIVFHASINRLFLKGYVYLLKNRLNTQEIWSLQSVHIYFQINKKLLLSTYYSTLKYCICPSSTIWSARGKLSYTIVYILHKEHHSYKSFVKCMLFIYEQFKEEKCNESIDQRPSLMYNFQNIIITLTFNIMYLPGVLIYTVSSY